PQPAPRPTRAWVHDALGPISDAAFDRLFERAAPGLERCRGDVDHDVRIQVFVNRGGSIPIAQPDVNEPHGDDDAARCVARALRSAGPLDDDDTDTIVTVMAHLEAR
nr:hypothetical protein [Myxococcota bacterium]